MRWKEPKIVGTITVGKDIRNRIRPKPKLSDPRFPNLCCEIILPGSKSEICYIGKGIDTTPIKLSFWKKIKKFSEKICKTKFKLYICIILFKT